MYAFEVERGVQCYYVPGYARPFLDRRQSRESCCNTSAEEIRCKSAAEAKWRAQLEWQQILFIRQRTLANITLLMIQFMMVSLPETVQATCIKCAAPALGAAFYFS